LIIPFRNHRTKVVEAGSKNLDIAVLKKDHPLTFLADSEVDKIVAGRDLLCFHFFFGDLSNTFLKEIEAEKEEQKEKKTGGK